jgi:hypothetical protein
LSAELDRVCAQIGDVPVGGACGTVEKCKPGAICAGPTALLTRCLEVCDGDEDCDAPGGKCKIGAGDTAQLCTDNCNLVTNEGCLVPGMACQFRLEEEVYFTSCDVEGPGIAQSLCTTNDDCSSGHVCLPSGGEDRCFLWCDVANPAVCGALECEPLGITIGTTSYGACN